MGKTLQKPFSQADVKILSEKPVFQAFFKLSNFRLNVAYIRTIGVNLLPVN